MLTRLLTISSTFSCGVVVDVVTGVVYEKSILSILIKYLELYATVLIETKAYGV